MCTSVTGAGKNVAIAVNRASPSGEEILEVFGGRVDESTVVLCDGKQSYNALFSQVFSNRQTAADEIFKLMTSRNGSFSSIQTVNEQKLLYI